MCLEPDRLVYNNIYVSQNGMASGTFVPRRRSRSEATATPYAVGYFASIAFGSVKIFAEFKPDSSITPLR